ncbi:Pestheic acid cluster transcriptional regulator 3 [Hyphodiscus hymeniophilus]|uniref:Pestheic acid cluster transcriptional regulator 3 n=1 Tax=Hyphodiscus hymeniophilus TaxID=353542 RepID=A0A9P7B187_9HELO|nr:Pestheic acid cluster transcriptional regulator 3 [Hyphodiscus hymeniophilus]
MSREVRSKGACWTCKLRKIKCDERKPRCATCLGLIPCLGYDPKPAWADGGEMQKAKVEELQIIVPASMRRRSRRRDIPTQGNGTQAVEVIQNKDPNGSITEQLSKLETETSGSDGILEDSKSAASAIVTDLEALAIITPVPRQHLTIDFLEYDSQASLLMHYLDVVFPGQFPFYNPSSSDGGRGWLLLIILRTKPLYHAALSMAARAEIAP